MQCPLVSIIIPLYNAESFIVETIESALQQTYKNVEIIIIDDGSIDSSFELAKQYEDDNIRIIKQANKGASAARNRGIELARGEYIQFLDADDLMHPSKIEYQVQTLQRFSELHLIGGTWQRFMDNVHKLYGPILPHTTKEIEYFDKIEWLINRPMMIPHAWLVSKKLISIAGRWDEELSLNDDGEFFYRVIAASEGVIIDSRAATYYRSFNSKSLSSRGGRKAMLSWIKSIQAYKKILNNLAKEKGNESVDRYFYLLHYWCLNKYPDLAEVCRSEMYYPEKKYHLEDKLVHNLSRFIGLGKAKHVREIINSSKRNFLLQKIHKTLKTNFGKQSY